MKSKVATEFRVNDREMLAPVLIDGIDRLHTHIKAENKEIEIQAKAQTIADSQLIQELRELELSARLVLIIPEVPDITSVNKQCTT